MDTSIIALLLIVACFAVMFGSRGGDHSPRVIQIMLDDNNDPNVRYGNTPYQPILAILVIIIVLIAVYAS